MKNIKLKFLSALFAILSIGVLSACGDDNNDPAPSIDFKLSATEVDFKQGGGDREITVQCSSAPEVTTDASWALTLGKPAAVGSKGNLYKFTVSAPVNDATDPRTATVTVKAGSQSGTVKITQAGTGFKLTEDAVSSTQFAMGGGAATVKFVTLSDYTVTPSASWITTTEESKADDAVTLRVNVAPNTGEAREGSVTIDAGGSTATVTVKQDAYDASAVNMSSNARQLAAKIYAGVNIGNTMETPDKEASWNCPRVNRDYIRGLKAMGFNAVRVPCAWDSHVTDKANNTIDPAWLDRVDEVVSWIVDEGMYAIVNIHWDGGWLEDNINKGYQESINKKQHDYWTQIATRLNGYDEHLLFAGMNEPGMNGGISGGLDAIMKYQQTFVDAVRATGGNNAVRVLINQGPSTNIDETVKASYKLPTDKVADRQMVEIHMYDPSDYTILEKGRKDGNADAWADYAKYYWGSEFHLPGSVRNTTWGNESDIEKQLKKMYNTYASKGIPVIMGEYACQVRDASAPDIDMERFEKSRAYWTRFVTKTAKDNGCVPFYWETGGDINRTNGSVRLKYAIDGLMQGASEGIYPF